MGKEDNSAWGPAGDSNSIPSHPGAKESCWWGWVLSHSCLSSLAGLLRGQPVHGLGGANNLPAILRFSPQREALPLPPVQRGQDGEGVDGRAAPFQATGQGGPRGGASPPEAALLPGKRGPWDGAGSLPWGTPCHKEMEKPKGVPGGGNAMVLQRTPYPECGASRVSGSVCSFPPLSLQVSVYQVLDQDRMDSPHGKKLLSARLLAAHGSGWEVFAITQAVSSRRSLCAAGDDGARCRLFLLQIKANVCVGGCSGVLPGTPGRQLPSHA